MTPQLAAIFAVLWLIAWPPSGLRAETMAESVQKAVSDTIETRRNAQKAEDAWAGQRKRMEIELAAEEQKSRILQEENLALEKRIDAAEKRVADKTRKVRETGRISKEIEPFLHRLAERLDRIVADGAPFLLPERNARIRRLKQQLESPDVAVSEKFRKAMEACLVEAEYGNTIEVYQEHLTVQEQPILANIFRLGRISLFYQTLDKAEAGRFDPARGRWEPFPRGFEREIRMAVEIGSRQRPADLLRLPVGRIEVP